MDKNSTRNLGLFALTGLFAFYGFTAHNLKIGSVSTSGIVIKYSKRGIASTISCPRTQNTIDETAADRFTKEECVHHVASKKLDNDDVEYTVTTYYRGHTNVGTKVYSAKDVAAKKDHNEKFIIGLVRKSKKKFDESPIGSSNVQLANTDQDKNAGSKKDAAVGEPPAVDSDDNTDQHVTDSKDKVKNKNARPEITVPGSSSDDDDSSDDTADRDSDLDSDSLMAAIEKYAGLKEAYVFCQLDSSDSKKVQKLIQKYDNGLLKYAKKVQEFRNSDDDNDSAKEPFDRLKDRDKEKLETFVATIDELGSGSGDNDLFNESAATSNNSASDISCLSERAKVIKGKAAQFKHYEKHIQPLLRQTIQADSPEQFKQTTLSLTGQDSGLRSLAKSNQYIEASFRADYSGAEANLNHKVNLKFNSKNPEILERNRYLINSNLTQTLSKLSAYNPEIKDNLVKSSQFWGQQNTILSQIKTDLSTLSNTKQTAGVDLSKSGLNKDTMDELTILEAMRKRIQELRRGSGNARKGANPAGQVDQRTGEYKGKIRVPQPNEIVAEEGNHPQ